jgi:hypothetical protein
LDPPASTYPSYPRGAASAAEGEAAALSDCFDNPLFAGGRGGCSSLPDRRDGGTGTSSNETVCGGVGLDMSLYLMPCRSSVVYDKSNKDEKGRCVWREQKGLVLFRFQI